MDAATLSFDVRFLFVPLLLSALLRFLLLRRLKRHYRDIWIGLGKPTLTSGWSVAQAESRFLRSHKFKDLNDRQLLFLKHSSRWSLWILMAAVALLFVVGD